MTEKNAVWTVARKYLAPYGRMVRMENRIETGTPDVFYTLRKTSGWLELKLIPENGRAPEHFTREQLLWAEGEVAVGGLWHLLGRCGPEWWLMTAPQARAWFEGRAPEPAVRASGRFPLREVLDCLAPLPAKELPRLSSCRTQELDLMTNYVPPSWLPPADRVIDYGNGRIGPVMWHWADEGTNLAEIAEREGFEVKVVLCGEDDEAARAYENGDDSDEILKMWKPPEKLDGGWRLASKDDTEDGLQATYLRRKSPDGSRV